MKKQELEKIISRIDKDIKNMEKHGNVLNLIFEYLTEKQNTIQEKINTCNNVIEDINLKKEYHYIENILNTFNDFLIEYYEVIG